MIGLIGGVALFFIAFVTVVFSAVASVGGGTMLFATMVMVVDFALVMPVFGAIQTSSAVSRVWFFREHVDKSIVLSLCRRVCPVRCFGRISLVLLSAYGRGATVFKNADCRVSVGLSQIFPVPGCDPGEDQDFTGCGWIGGFDCRRDWCGNFSVY